MDENGSPTSWAEFSSGKPDITPGTVIPSFVDGHEWAACFGLSWADLLLADQAHHQRMIRPGGQFVRKVSGTMGVAAARSEIVRYFLEHTDGEWLWMVDTDMGLGLDTVERMVASAVANDVPILGALCFAQKVDKALAMPAYQAVRYRIQPTLYEFLSVEGTGEVGFQSITKYRRNAFQKVAGTGAACLLMHRSALDALGSDPFRPITLPNGAGQGQDRTFSEDLSFCFRARAEGLEIGVDTSIQTTHYKGGIFLDETSFALQQETLIQARGHAVARQAEAYTRNGLIIPREASL